MKTYLFTCLILLTTSLTFGQANFQKNQEVTVFDGYEWIDSKIIDINDKGQYLVYVDKKMTKTKWVGAEDIEAYATDNSEDVVIIKVNVTESQEVPILKVGDRVKYKSGENWIESEIIALGANETVKVYANAEKTESIYKEEKDVIITFSVSQLEYRTKTVKKTIHYNLNEEVQYLSNNQWITGVISKMNDSNQVFIDGKWHEIDVVRKK